MNGEAWVYTHYSADGVALYVGCTGDLAERLRRHRSTAKWFGEIHTVGVLGPYPHAAALVLESRLIELHQPVNNVIGTARETQLHILNGATRRYITARCDELAHIAQRRWVLSGRVGRMPVPNDYRDWVRRNLTAGDREFIRESLAVAS